MVLELKSLAFSRGRGQRQCRMIRTALVAMGTERKDTHTSAISSVICSVTQSKEFPGTSQAPTNTS